MERDDEVHRPISMDTKPDAITHNAHDEAPDTGTLIVDCSHLPSAHFLAATGPKIEVDGREIKANWGPWPVELPAGTHELRVSTRYMGEMGPATMSVEIQPGRDTRVFYRAPATIFSDGSLGDVPQETKGMGGLGIMIAIPIVLMLISLALMAQS